MIQYLKKITTHRLMNPYFKTILSKIVNRVLNIVKNLKKRAEEEESKEIQNRKVKETVKTNF